jgi:hypothetical protein
MFSFLCLLLYIFNYRVHRYYCKLNSKINRIIILLTIANKYYKPYLYRALTRAFIIKEINSLRTLLTGVSSQELSPGNQLPARVRVHLGPISVRRPIDT